MHLFIQIGTQFDLKEELFRNYGGLFGPYSDPTLAHHWGRGPQLTATVVWVDPNNNIAGSYDIPVRGAEYVGIQTPSFQKPLRPGIWTVKVSIK